MTARGKYLTEWDGPTHPDAARVMAEYDRTYQTWEDDELIHFVIGPPRVTAYTEDGRPFQFSHPCYTIDEDGQRDEWPLIETVDRPLETKKHNRLA